jgi:hypothetical protein
LKGAAKVDSESIMITSLLGTQIIQAVQLWYVSIASQISVIVMPSGD